MKIPKYVQKLINDRYKYAVKLMKTSSELDDWLDENGIDIFTDYCATGVLIYTEPDVARDCVIRDIEIKQIEKAKEKYSKR